LLLLVPQHWQLQEINIIVQATEMHSINNLSPEDTHGDISQNKCFSHISQTADSFQHVLI
jgi:hypothetical protein